MWSRAGLHRNYSSIIVQTLFSSTTPDTIPLNPVLLSSWKCNSYQKWIKIFSCWTCLIFMRLVCLPTCSICPKICQTSLPQQGLSLLSSSKWILQDTSFLQILLKTEAWWNGAPAKTQFVCTGLCQQYLSRIPHTMSLWKRLCQGTPAGSSCSGARTLLLAQPQPTAGPTVLLPWPEPWVPGGSRGDLAEGLLRCLQAELKACGSLTTQLTAYFQHKHF